MHKFKVPAREHSAQRNTTLLLFPVHRLNCVDIRILQVTVTLLDHLQMEQISYRESLICPLSGYSRDQAQLAEVDDHLAPIDQAMLDHFSLLTTSGEEEKNSF